MRRAAVVGLWALVALPALGVAVRPFAGMQGDLSIRPPANDGCGDPPQTNLVAWFDGRDIDGSNNSTLTDRGTIGTWVSSGTTGGLTQGTAAAQPHFVADCSHTGQGCVRFDGGDRLTATTASEWTFLNSGADSSVYLVWIAENDNPNALYVLASSQATVLGSTSRGVTWWFDDRSGSAREDRAALYMSSGTVANFNYVGVDNTLPQRKWHTFATVLNDDGGVGTDLDLYVDNALSTSLAVSGTYSALDPSSALNIGSAVGGTSPMSGDIAQVLAYSAAHDATGRAAVQSWIDCVYGDMPFIASATGLACAAAVTPITKLCESSTCSIGVLGDSLTAAAGSVGVTSWATTLDTNLAATYTVTNAAISGANTTTAKAVQWHDTLSGTNKDVLIMLIGTNDLPTRTAAAILVDINEMVTDALYECENVLTISVLPRGTSAGWTAGMQTELDALNAGLAAAATGKRMHLDLYATFENDAVPDALDPAYNYGDGLHINNAGELVIEAAVRALVGP